MSSHVQKPKKQLPMHKFIATGGKPKARQNAAPKAVANKKK
jgi:hypothetical protein